MTKSYLRQDCRSTIDDEPLDKNREVRMMISQLLERNEVGDGSTHNRARDSSTGVQSTKWRQASRSGTIKKTTKISKGQVIVCRPVQATQRHRRATAEVIHRKPTPPKPTCRKRVMLIIFPGDKSLQTYNHIPFSPNKKKRDRNVKKDSGDQEKKKRRRSVARRFRFPSHSKASEEDPAEAISPPTISPTRSNAKTTIAPNHTFFLHPPSGKGDFPLHQCTPCSSFSPRNTLFHNVFFLLFSSSVYHDPKARIAAM